MQSQLTTNVDQAQIDAFENSCGIVIWDQATIIRHSGSDALDLLHRLTTKELLSVAEGRSKRTALTSDKGRVVDVFLVAHVGENQLLLISDSNESEKTVAAIDYYTIIEDAELTDLSKTHTRVSLIGPNARQVLESTLNTALDADQTMTISFGEDSVIVMSDTSRGVEWIDVIYETGAFERIIEGFARSGGFIVDSDHFEHFRIANAIPGSNREYGEHSNPIEAGLLHLIDWDKGCYVGQEVIARLDAYDKVQRNVRILKSDSPLEEGTKLTAGSKPAGVITSVSQLKTAEGDFISLALVRMAFLETGTALLANETPAVVGE